MRRSAATGPVGGSDATTSPETAGTWPVKTWLDTGSPSGNSTCVPLIGSIKAFGRYMESRTTSTAPWASIGPVSERRSTPFVMSTIDAFPPMSGMTITESPTVGAD